MAPQNQADLPFLPSRDVPGYSDAFLRQYGLNGRGSLPFYRDLARLAASGSTLRLPAWTALADALIRVRGDDRGLRHKGRIDDKLQQLRKQGLIAWAGPHSYEIDLLPPDQWRPRETAEREPELRVLSSCERQGGLFEREAEPAGFGIFEGDPTPETESAFGFQESAFPAKPKALSVLPEEPHTSYPRAPGVESSRLDESTETNSKEISQEELTEAQHAWLRTRARWRAKGVTHRIRGADGARNVQAFVKAAILLGRGQLAEAVYAAAAEAPVLAAKITAHPFALVWTEWKRDKRFTAKIASLQLPANWDEGLRNPPQRE